MTKHLKKSGFTMVELIIYLALVVVITTIFTGFTTSVVKNSARILAKNEVYYNGQFLLSRIIQEIKTAKNIGMVNTDSITMTNEYGQEVIVAFDSVNNTINYTLDSVTTIITLDYIRATELTFHQRGDSLIAIHLMVDNGPSNSVAFPHEANFYTAASPRSQLY